MKTLLICHAENALNRQGLARWLVSFSDLVGVIILKERPSRVWRRLRAEIKRVGALGFLDVLAFRVYYRLALARRDAQWADRRLQELLAAYPPPVREPALLFTSSPNTPEAEAFIRDLAPDLMVARCKTLLQERIFSRPPLGTFVMHPGICPEYRNAHGCFWALVNRDLDRVGLTLLKIDAGIDTGPIYGYFSYDYDELAESPIIIQQRVVFDNLEAIREKLLQIYQGLAQPIDITGRASAVWGQPQLAKYLQWQRAARRRRQPG